MAPIAYNTPIHGTNNSSSLRIAVVGGGVVGVCAGLALQQEYSQAEILIISEKWTPLTTGDISAGLIFPYAIGKQNDPRLMRRIFVDTIKFYQQLIRNPDSGKFGIYYLLNFIKF